MGIRAHDFAPCAPGTPNSLPVQAVSTSENPFDWNMIFTLPGGEARLWWKVSKETMAAPPPKSHPPALLPPRKISCRWSEAKRIRSLPAPETEIRSRENFFEKST